MIHLLPLGLLLVFALFSLQAGALTCFPYSSYEVENNAVYYQHTGRQRRLRGIDPTTFRPMIPQGSTGPCMAGYAKDARTVLYEGARITKAHAESFEVLGIYAKDRKHLYFKRRVISGAPEKFQVFDNRYATDGNTIFCGASRLPGKKLVALGHAYAKSEIAVFHECKVLATLDPVSFNVFQNRRSYGRDHKVVILDGKPIPGADPASFEVFAPTVGHARDRRHVYYHGKVIPGADPKTIEQIDGYYFRDARAVYLEGREIVDADPKTFRLSKFDGYAVDRSRVYRIGDVVPGRDPATFE